MSSSPCWPTRSPPGRSSWRRAPGYILAQIAGAFAGVAAANVMFGEAVFAWSGRVREGPALLWSECVATFGLLAVIAGCSRRRPGAVPFAVGAYITAAYWFTASTSFANPAVTLARSVSDTFAGIRPADVPGFILAQALGAAAATGLFRWLVPGAKTVLFACAHNAGRSQMAAALFNASADPALARAVSAGTAPAERVHPEVVAVMREAGIDLSAATPRMLTADLARSANLLVTMGCGETCPVVPGLPREDWPLPDPKGQPPERVREIRDEIGRMVRELVTRSGWARKA